MGDTFTIRGLIFGPPVFSTRRGLSRGWVWDISDPFLPREVGYYLSPRYPGRFPNRQVREAYQDPDSALIYMTDGNGGGVTVLRWVGPIPRRPPVPAIVPGAR